MNLVSPESVGFSSERLGRLDDRLQGYVDSGKLAGALTMLARGGEVFHLQPYGVMDLESGAPIEHDTIFRLYSMTKPITSVAVMMLYEEGHFSLEDPVSKFIPELSDLKVYDGMGERGMKLVEQQRPITIRHLLTHTSGISYGLYQDTPIDNMYREERINDADSNLQEVVEKIGGFPPAAPAGRQVAIQYGDHCARTLHRGRLGSAVRPVPTRQDILATRHVRHVVLRT